jgi:hypothetical protein
MPHPYVETVTITNGKVVLKLQLGLELAGVPVEVTGYATQNGGAFANINHVQTVNKNPDNSVVMYVEATPSQEFQNGENVTVVLRAARVWVTVLNPAGQNAPQGHVEPADPPGDPTWNLKRASWLSDGPSAQWEPGQNGSAGASFPPA